MGMIIGYNNEKNELAQLREMLHNADKYRECGIRIPRGIILRGDPGVGKTVMARSLADDGIELVELKAANCCNDTVAEDIQNAFAEAKEKAPSVLLIDEMDKIAQTEHRPFRIIGENDTAMKVLLQELDALTADDMVLVAATCNSVDELNPALIRSGRFDRHLLIAKPDKDTRRQILEAYFGAITIPNELDFDYLASVTGGYSGAELECIANETGIRAMNRPEQYIGMDDVVDVISRKELEAEEKGASPNEKTRYRLAVHEAGHALVGLVLQPDSVVKATIKTQGEARGHVMLMYRNNDDLLTRTEMENSVTVLLAGHVAERVALGEYLLGSGSDINKATESIGSLLTESGVYGYDYVGERSNYGGQNSESFLKGLDVKRAELLEGMDHRAEEITRTHRRAYDESVTRLADRGVLAKEEMQEILAG